MSARNFRVIVTGGRDYVLTPADFTFLLRTLRTLGAKEVYTDGTEGVAAQVEAWAQRRGFAVWRVTANWMHDGPATRPERNTTLAGLARAVIAFPGDHATDDMLTKARKRRLRVVESPGRLLANPPTMDRRFISSPTSPHHRPQLSP
jgi:hypothetical protein